MINLLRFATAFHSSGDAAAAVVAPAHAGAFQSAAGGPDLADASDAVFEGLVDRYYRRTYSLIYRMIRNEQDAADLTQETFVRVYRALPRLRETGAQAAWVRRIATNLCLDFLRRRMSAPSCSSLDARPSEDSDTTLSWDISDPSGEPDRIYSSQERLAILHRAVASLPDDYRHVIVMHHLEELRVEEIADALGVPPGTIKSRLSRARRELMRKLSPYFDPDLALPGR